MPERSEPEEYSKLEQTLTTMFHAPQPGVEFIDRLERQLKEDGRANGRNLAIQRPLSTRLSGLRTALAWGLLALLLVAGLIWGINNLIPHPSPSKPENSTEWSSNLGKLAYVGDDGNIWIKSLRVEEIIRITDGGGNRSPEWSPTGEWLAYRHGEDQVFFVKADGSESRPVDDRPIGEFAWSPVSDQLAYISQGTELRVASSGQNEVMTLVEGPENRQVNNPTWSPDGKWIAYRASERINSALTYLGIWKVSSEGGDPQEVYASENTEMLSSVYKLAGWTSDGQNLLFWAGNPFLSASLAADGTPLMLLPADGGAQRQLAKSVLQYQDFVRPDPNNGGRVAVISGGGREAWTGKQLVLIENDQAYEITGPENNATSPAWSPLGEQIVYVAMDQPGDALSDGDPTRQALMGRRLWLFDLSTGEHRQLTSDPAYRDEYPLLSPDGKTLLFVRLDEQDQVSLWILPFDPGEQGKEPSLVLENLPDPEGWFGYYGHIDLSQQFDWWRGPRLDTGEKVIGEWDTPNNTLVFQSNRDGNDEIYRLDTGGGDPENLTRHPASDTSPAWSPDGQRIAFLSDRTGKTEIFLMDASGGDLRQLTDSPEVTWQSPYAPLSWSPDGRQIAIPGSLDGGDENHANLYLVDVDTGETHRLLDSPFAHYPKWSPDGTRLAFRGFQDGRSDLYLVNAGGSGLLRVPADVGEDGAFLADDFSWSPDGRQLAFLATGPYAGTWPNLQLTPPTKAVFMTVNADGSNQNTLQEIKPLPNGILFASWSPDGKMLMFVRSVGSSGCFHVILLPLDGSGLREVQGLCYTARTSPPDWSSDGKWLFFTADRDGEYADSALFALDVKSVLENPDAPSYARQTGENGLDKNPQARPVSRANATATSSPTELPDNHILYIVEEGDTLESISVKTSVPAETIHALNDILLGSHDLTPGMVLILGFEGQLPVFYTVQPGDTVIGIAEKNNVSVQTIAALNRMNENFDAGYRMVLSPGRQLIIGLEGLPETNGNTQSMETPGMLQGLEELQALTEHLKRSLTGVPGWLHRTYRHQGSAVLLPDGQPGPQEYRMEEWYLLDERGLAVSSVLLMQDMDGNILQVRTYDDGVWHDLTFGTTEPAEPFEVDLDFGFLEKAADLQARGGSLEFSEVGFEGKRIPIVVLAESDLQDEAVFDPHTGALQSLSSWRWSASRDAKAILSGIVIEAQERAEPPEEILSYLNGGPLSPTALPSGGNPPGNFNPALSHLTFHWTPEDGPYLGEIFADGYLLGKVDFGSIQGGFCDRSWNGGLIAFLYDPTASSGLLRRSLRTIRWFSLKDLSQVYEPLPDFDLLGPVTFAPGDFRLAFAACQEADCGLNVYNIQTGELRQISSDQTFDPPIWSPDGKQIAIRLPTNEEAGIINRIRVLDAETGEQVYFGYPDGPGSPLNDWGSQDLFTVNGTEGCELP